MSGVANTDYNGAHSWLLEYILRAKSGEIVVGRELMQEFDLLLPCFEDPEIRVDFTEAHKRIKFIETNLRHFEAPFAGKPFLLMLFQKAFIEAIYAFQIQDPDTGQWVRKHQDVLFVVGRKGGKTPLISAVCLAEYFCGSMGTKILCGSNDYEQADLMFDAINAMREESPALERVTRKNIKGIRFGNPRQKKHSGKFSYQNKGSIRRISSKTGAKEGRNIRVGAVDEIHELANNASIMPIRQALSTQAEPLYIELTTEGFVEGYLTERLKEARQVLAGEIRRPRWLIWLYTQDSESEIWRDERSWLKANPGLGVIKQWSFLRGMVEEAKTSTATRAFVLAKDFNLPAAAASQAWLTPEIIDRPGKFDVEDMRGAIALGGCDLSETTDLTCAKAFIMRPGSATKFILSKYLIPESQIVQSPAEYKKKYEAWARDGFLTVCPGNENDYSLITAWYAGLVKQYGIKTFRICMDRWGANYLARELEETGFDTDKVTFDRAHISSPMKHAEADLRAGLVNYNQNPVDRWCLENCGAKVDSLGQIMPVKIEQAKRIDGAVALILCYYAYGICRSEYLQAIR